MYSAKEMCNLIDPTNRSHPRAFSTYKLFEILFRFRKEDLEIFGFCWYSESVSLLQTISLCYFQKQNWYKRKYRSPLYRVLSRLGIHNSSLLNDCFRRVATANPIWKDIFELCFKAQSSNFSFATFQWKETFELWALSVERSKSFGNVTPRGIGCTTTCPSSLSVRVSVWVSMWVYVFCEGV